MLFGEQDKYFKRIEEKRDVMISARGNRVAVTGGAQDVTVVCEALQKLYGRLEEGLVVGISEVDAALRFAKGNEGLSEERIEEKHAIPTRQSLIMPRTKGQANYINALKENDLVFGVGPAGTGKTYLAVAMGVSLLLEGKVDRIILSRPAVEAGERLGFLPGDLKEKVDPYLRPLYDALHDMLPAHQVEKRLQSDEIEIAPLAYMRGRTLSNAYVILDEAQNTLPTQMKMFLTRMGEGSKMVITGDLTQVDLPRGVTSGLRQAIQYLEKIEEIGFFYFTEKDVVRHTLVSRIIQAYDKVS